MTANEYRAAIKRLGLSQIAAARLFDVDARTSRKWALAESRVAGPAAGWLEYLWETRDTPAFKKLMKRVKQT